MEQDDYIRNIRALEKYLPVMTKAEQDELIAGKFDWPEDTLIKWSGKLAEREAFLKDLRDKVYARQKEIKFAKSSQKKTSQK